MVSLLIEFALIKSKSARNYFKIYPEIKKKYFWGGLPWTQSFFDETIGNANDEAICKYVSGQLKEMDVQEENASSSDSYKAR